jgi:predicted metal-dependent hydrolase
MGCKIMKIQIDDKAITYRLERKNRKTLSIKVTSHREVIVSAPLFLNDEKVEEIIKSRFNWIISKLETVKAASKDEPSNLKTLKFLGQDYKLNLNESAGSVIKVIFNKSEFQVFIPRSMKDNRNEYIRDALEKWYRVQAKAILEDRTVHYAEKLKVKPERIVIKDQKTKWGSCSSKGNINYNYRIVMAPMNIIDYLVVHEMCHLIHMNHSKDFWKLVESILPNSKVYREWLKVNGNSLILF